MTNATEAELRSSVVVEFFNEGVRQEMEAGYTFSEAVVRVRNALGLPEVRFGYNPLKRRTPPAREH